MKVPAINLEVLKILYILLHRHLTIIESFNIFPEIFKDMFDISLICILLTYRLKNSSIVKVCTKFSSELISVPFIVCMRREKKRREDRPQIEKVDFRVREWRDSPSCSAVDCQRREISFIPLIMKGT